MWRPAGRSKDRAAAEDDDRPSKVACARKHPKPGDDTGPLPEPVEEMRQAILAATHSGNIEDLRVPLDWNELKPEVAATGRRGSHRHWKKTSADGNGREILAALAEILPMRAAELPFGKDLENNIIYVWPYLAEVDLGKLTPAQEVDLIRLVGPAEAQGDARRRRSGRGGG